MSVRISTSRVGQYLYAWTRMHRGRVYCIGQLTHPNGAIRKTWIDGKPLWRYWLRHPIMGCHMYAVTRNLMKGLTRKLTRP